MSTSELDIIWEKSFGESNSYSDTPYEVKVASDGSIYIVGAAGGDFNNQSLNTNSGGTDAFIIKLDSDGNEQWTKFYGLSSEIGYRYYNSRSLSLDSSGNIYLLGEQSGGGINGVSDIGGGDAFVIKLDSDGNEQWTRMYGSTYYERARSLKISSDGSVYIAGTTQGPLVGDVSEWHGSQGGDAYVIKLDSDGNEQWKKMYGSSSVDYGNSLTIDSNGFIYLVGTAGGEINGEPIPNNAGSLDVFIIKLNSSGDSQWTKLFGTTNYDYGYSVVTDTNGYIYLTGETRGNLNGITNSGGQDIFFMKLDSDGNEQLTKLFGSGSGNDLGWGLSIGNDSNIYLSGQVGGSSFNGESNSGGWDAFLMALDPNGNEQWTKLFGNNNGDYSFSVTSDNSGYVYLSYESNVSSQNVSTGGNISIVKLGDITAPSAPSSLTTTSTTTSDTTPTITGSAEAGSTVKIYSGTTLLGSATADGNGAFSVTSSTLSEGSYSLTATATDAAGNTSSASFALSITVDTTAPTISSFSPADDATAVATNSNIVLNFSEAVDVETGNFIIYKTSDNSAVETIDVTSSQVTGSGSTQITINPSNDFAVQTEFYVQIDATALDDTAGNSYAGISDKTSLSFTTESAKIDLGKLSNGIIYSYNNEISGSNQLKYIFSVDGNIYPYFTLSGMSSDLDLDIYEVTTTVSGQRNSTLIKSSQNAGIETEFFFKALDTGDYEVLITPYENNSNETINFNLEIDNKSFEQNTNLPNDPLFKDQWYLFNTGQADAIDNYDIFAPEAWKDTSSSPKITVAVIDSGIDYNHVDLDDNIWINTGEIKNNNIDDDGNGYIDDYQGWDFYYQDNDPMDYTNHGTHVAGIIGAEGNNSIGITGVSWDIELMNLKVFSDSNTGKGSKNLLPAIRYAADNGADIINLSLGLNLGKATDYIFPSITFEDFKQAFPEVYQSYYDSLKYASDKGITIIASLGNDTTNTEQYTSIPADFSIEIPGMISVAAINNQGDISYYSNYGNITSIASPGGAQYFENDPNGILSTVIDNDYKYLQGTSMAAPIVTGAAALILEKDPTLTPEEVKNVIMSGGASLKNLQNIVTDGRFLDLDGSLQLVSSTQVISNHSIGNFYNLKGIKDFDGYHHANSGKVSDAVKNAYEYQGLLDVNADGKKEAIYTNKESGRWVTASINSSGEIDYSEYGQGGTTRVVGIYIDPLVTSGEVEQFGPYDSQRRFQNDLYIDNLIAKTSGDYDGDGFQEVYWKTNDGTAYLRALMHADGNIQYANYQSEEQMSDYLTSKGYESVVSDVI